MLVGLEASQKYSPESCLLHDSLYQMTLVSIFVSSDMGFLLFRFKSLKLIGKDPVST